MQSGTIYISSDVKTYIPFMCELIFLQYGLDTHLPQVAARLLEVVCMELEEGKEGGREERGKEGGEGERSTVKYEPSDKGLYTCAVIFLY